MQVQDATNNMVYGFEFIIENLFLNPMNRRD